MEGQRSELLLQRNFRCLKIVWEIENSFCVAYKKKWEICSPLFTVHYTVPLKWRFILTNSEDDGDEECVASIHLERHESADKTLPVRVSWKLSYERGVICHEEAEFKTCGRIQSKIKDFNKLHEKLQDISIRKFNIEAIFILTGLNHNVTYGKTNDLGFRTLSENITNVYIFKSSTYDLTVNIGKTSIRGHKAILSATNEVLSGIIDQYRGTNEVSMPYIDEESAEHIFCYLYSGNLDSILRKPSVSTHDAIKVFKVKELEKYYIKDEFILRTKHEAKEFYHKWIVSDIQIRNENSLFSPLFGDRDLNITFQLRLEQKEIDTKDCIGIFLDGSLPEEWKELYIVFELLDKYSYSTNLRKAVRWSLKHGGPRGIEDFFSRDIFNKIYTAGNRTLRILCSLFIPNNSAPASLFLVSVRNCLPPYINPEEHYTLFSNRIKSLLKSGKYSDLTIRCGDKHFPVHKWILSARSPVFSEFIRRLPENEKVINLEDTDPAIMEILLCYMYSGVLRVEGVSDGLKIYEAVDKFGMSILKHQITNILKENM